MKFSFFTLIILILASCSYKKNQLENQTQNGHHELYSQPEAIKATKQDDYRKIVIAATNDIHGHYEPHLLNFSDRHNKGDQTIKVGGVDFISSYFKILREQYGQILLLDSGDIFSAKADEMHFVSDFYSVLDYDALTIGLSDFNLKLPQKFQTSADFFKGFAAHSKTPLILSNLYELKTGRVVEWTGTLPYLIKEINGVKIGILGIMPDDFVGQTPVDNRVGLYVESMLQSTMRHARLLRSLGAEIIVAVTHQGLTCGEELSQELKIPLSKVNFEPHKKNICELTGKMGEYLNRLPPNLVDVMIGGRTHQKVANVINTTLVLSGFEDGKSFSYAELFVENKSKKLNKEKTVIHQPVMFCQEFFKETNDCYSEDQSVDHKVRSTAKFLGQEVKPDTALDQKFHYYLKTKVQTTATKLKNTQKVMDFYDGNIAYLAEGSTDSKLILLSVDGKSLLHILESDYNQGLRSHWIPSPFKVENNLLNLSIQGSGLDMNANYKILVSMDDVQKHNGLKKFVGRAGNKTLNHVSWSAPDMGQDKVSSAMSASEAVR